MDVTTIPVPTVALANVPALERVTTSAPTIPTNVDPAMVAVVVLSYTLLSAIDPVTVKVFGEMVYTNVALPVPPALVAEIDTLNEPTSDGVPEISPVAVFTVKPAGNPVALNEVGVSVAVMV